MSKWTHRDLCDLGVKWLQRPPSANGMGCNFAVSEIQSSYNGEQVDVFGYRCSYPMYGSYMIEVKVSRSDFLKDMSKPHRLNPHLGVGKYRIYMCPEDVIHPSDIPHGWGLVWVNNRGHIKPQSLDNIVECSRRNHDNEGYIMARLISRFDDVEKLNKTLKEANRMSTNAWNEVEKLRKENRRLSQLYWELRESEDDQTD